MKTSIIMLVMLISLGCWSQDLIILRSGEHIDCKITNIDSTVLYYNFQKNNRILSSYTVFEDVRSYRIGPVENLQIDSTNSLNVRTEKVVVIDTTKFLKESHEWVNLITLAPALGMYAAGWTMRYYGFSLRSTSKWTLPVVLSFERFNLDRGFNPEAYFEEVDMQYYSIGLNPFYRISRMCFLNLGFNFIYGNEILNTWVDSKSFQGFAFSQGISFIPSSKAGIVTGLSIYEKILSSEVYKKDFGVKVELGVKF